MTGPKLTHEIIGAAIAVHRELGPGPLTAAYEKCLCSERTNRNIQFAKQKPIPVYKNAKLDCGCRADTAVAERIMVETKASAAVAPIHEAVC
jgi:GxxExxY protein